MAIRVPIKAEMDDGRILEAVVDQRDYAKAEGAGITLDVTNLWMRYLAWSALKRNKQYGGTWEQFNEVDCVEATDGKTEEPAGADEGLDPGRSASSAGS